MAKLSGLVAVVSELRTERTNLVSQLKHVDTALSVIGKLNGGRPHAKPKGTMSAAGRRRISLAQKPRWAKWTANGKTDVTKPRRRMSASARRKIAAAQRARWAKVKKKAA
jgi:hypothetical protein